MKLDICWMTQAFMDSVLDIERRCFQFAWPIDDFRRVLRARNAIGTLAFVGDRKQGVVAGFSIYEIHATRYHLLNLAVHPEWQRLGVGRALIGDLRLSRERRSRIMLEVRETNVSAQLFFKSLGFKAVSVLRDFYKETTEDAYVMQYRYGESATVGRSANVLVID